jgi:hypothetical protein
MLNIAALRPFQHLQKRSALLTPTNWITIPTPKQSTMGFIGFLIQKSTGARCQIWSRGGLAGKFWRRFRDHSQRRRNRSCPTTGRRVARCTRSTPRNDETLSAPKLS